MVGSGLSLQYSNKNQIFGGLLITSLINVCIRIENRGGEQELIMKEKHWSFKVA